MTVDSIMQPKYDSMIGTPIRKICENRYTTIIKYLYTKAA